jgi:hypothetical protein
MWPPPASAAIAEPATGDLDPPMPIIVVRFTVSRFTRPPFLLVHLWFRFAPELHGNYQKVSALNAILKLDPGD